MTKGEGFRIWTEHKMNLHLLECDHLCRDFWTPQGDRVTPSLFHSSERLTHLLHSTDYDETIWYLSLSALDSQIP